MVNIADEIKVFIPLLNRLVDGYQTIIIEMLMPQQQYVLL